MNSDHKISDRFRIGQNLQLTNTNDNAPNTLSAQDGLLWSAIRFHPGLPVRNPDGTYGTTDGLVPLEISTILSIRLTRRIKTIPVTGFWETSPASMRS